MWLGHVFQCDPWRNVPNALRQALQAASRDGSDVVKALGPARAGAKLADLGKQSVDEGLSHDREGANLAGHDSQRAAETRPRC